MVKTDIFLVITVSVLFVIFVYLTFITDYFKNRELFGNQQINFGDIQSKLAGNPPINSLYKQLSDSAEKSFQESFISNDDFVQDKARGPNSTSGKF